MDDAERLRQLRDLVTGDDPTSRDHLVPISASQPMLRGTVSPALAAQYEATPSGLLVPRGAIRRPFPIDQVQAYLTADETLGVTVELELVLHALSRVSLEEVLTWTAKWMSAVRRPGSRQQEVDAEFARTYLREPHRTRVLNLVKAGRVLVLPQALLVLAKAALHLCPARGIPEREDHASLVFALLGLTEHLGAEGADVAPDGDLNITEKPGVLGREVIANQLANRNRQEAGRWAAFERCWRELPTELADHPRVVDMAAAYRDATGVSLDDLVTVCACLWASAVNGHPHMTPDYFSALGWSEARLSAALQLIAADPRQLAQMHSEEDEEYGTAWSTLTFQQYPVVRWESGHLTVLDPDLLVDRATGVWPLYDILRELTNQGNTPAARRVRGSYDHIFEHYVSEIASTIVDAGHLQRAYREHEIQNAFGRKHQVADLAIDYGSAWVVLDATTSGIQRLTFAGTSDESVLQDIATVVRKARQIDSTVALLRANQEALTGHPFVGVRRFHPVVVVSSASPCGPIFMTLLREGLAKEKLLQDSDIAPLEILELEDLEVAEGLADTGGPTLADILRGKENSGLRDMSLKDYVLLDLRLRPSRPKRVESTWRRWMDTAVQALRGAA